MDNGTLMLNGTDYSGGKGTLVVNGVAYSGKGGSGGGQASHIEPLYVSQNREGSISYVTKVKAGKYICILLSGNLSAMTPSGITSSGTEIFSYQCELTNSRYCFVKEFELDEDGWITCSGGYENSGYKTSRRCIVRVDFDLDANIFNDINYENKYVASRTVTTTSPKTFFCVFNTIQSVVADVTSSQEITEKMDFGNCCLAYDANNNGESYTLSASIVAETWSTNVYLAFTVK